MGIYTYYYFCLVYFWNEGTFWVDIEDKAVVGLVVDNFADDADVFRLELSDGPGRTGVVEGGVGLLMIPCVLHVYGAYKYNRYK